LRIRGRRSGAVAELAGGVITEAGHAARALADAGMARAGRDLDRVVDARHRLWGGAHLLALISVLAVRPRSPAADRATLGDRARMGATDIEIDHVREAGDHGGLARARDTRDAEATGDVVAPAGDLARAQARA